MIRVYFDTNVFSYLKNSTDPVIQNFHDSLIKYKSTLLYCYSHGHLLDFKQDKSDKKYDDLNFIETLVDNNYISYHALEKTTTCYLAKPREAFDGLGTDMKIDFKSLLEIDISKLSTEQQEQFTITKNLLFNQEIDLNIEAANQLPDDVKQVLSKLLPLTKSKYTFLEFTELFTQMYDELIENKSVYKDLRNYLDKNLNNGKFVIDENTIGFNDKLKNSILNKTFVEFVNNSLNPQGSKQVTEYEFHVQAYTTLDLLGISKDPSKAKFRNIFNDGIHSYYGAFCDYVVSNDDDFIKKTKALYKLIGLKTNVLSLNEFMQSIEIISNIEEQDKMTFIQLLRVDMLKGVVLGSKPSLRYNRQTTTIKPIHRYLGYFNKLEQMSEPNFDIVLTNQRNNYSNFVFYKEFEAVTNKAVKLFGEDLNLKGVFNNEIEIAEIHDFKWNGRRWFIGEFELVLEINKGTQKLSLTLIIPKSKHIS